MPAPQGFIDGFGRAVVHINLLCKCGSKVTVTKDEANNSAQCRSCLGRVLVPPHKILISLGALHRDLRLRILGIIALGLLVVAAAVAGIYAQSKRQQLLSEAPTVVRDQIDRVSRAVEKARNEVRNNGGIPEEDGRVRSLNSLLGDLKAQPQNKEEAAKVNFAEISGIMEEVGPEDRTEATNEWLAGAQGARFGETLQYGLIAGAGIVFLLLIPLSARISTHRHRILNHEKQTHSKILSR